MISFSEELLLQKNSLGENSVFCVTVTLLPQHIKPKLSTWLDTTWGKWSKCVLTSRTEYERICVTQIETDRERAVTGPDRLSGAE